MREMSLDNRDSVFVCSINVNLFLHNGMTVVGFRVLREWNLVILMHTPTVSPLSKKMNMKVTEVLAGVP